MPEIGEIKRGTEIGYKNNMGHIWHACEKCGKERWVIIKGGIPKTTLCHHCAASINGKDNANWRGGKTIDNGKYVLIRLYPDDFFYPMVGTNGYVREHRLVMAKHLGRCLLPWEVVHHKNSDKQDNRIENLQLLPHQKFHIVDSLTKSKILDLEKRILFLETENAKLREVKRCVM